MIFGDLYVLGTGIARIIIWFGTCSECNFVLSWFLASCRLAVECSDGESIEFYVLASCNVAL